MTQRQLHNIESIIDRVERLQHEMQDERTKDRLDRAKSILMDILIAGI